MSRIRRAPACVLTTLATAGQIAITGIAAIAAPLQCATVCYDLNANAACDGGEPSASTGADGRFTLAVDIAQAGRHAVVAQVPASAIDAGSGAAVGTAFTLSAPATGHADARSIAVTPLSTAVMDLSAWAGLPTSDAAAAVQRSLGLAASPLADYLATAAPQTVGVPGPFVSVRRFSWTDADNHNLFALVGDSTPDADGGHWAGDVRANVVNGQLRPFNRNTAYLDRRSGQWVVCDNSWHTVRSTPAAAGRPLQSLYCAGQTSLSRVAEQDVSGRRIADVVAEMRAWPLADSPGAGTDDNGLPVHWGPPPAALGDAVFPAGSVISSRAQLTDVGGTERFSLTDKPRVVPASGSGAYRQATSLEALKRMAGNLVQADAAVDAGNSIFLQDLPATVADPALRAVRRYRVAFDPAGDAVRFYGCDVVDATNASRNCVALGDGSSRIDTVGGARVLRFTAGYPAALTAALKRQRLFVERHGVVFGGHRDLERMVFQQRPNTVAWNALRSALALPEPAAPTPPAAATTGSTLRSFTYADPGNYRARLFDFDTAVQDAEGFSTSHERYLIRSGGRDQAFERNQLYWTGSTWYACPSDGRGVSKTRQVAPFDSVFCGTYVDQIIGTTTLTLDGRSMAEVVRDIRAFGSRDGSFDYAGWGPNPDVHTQLAGHAFPAGSTMSYRSNQARVTPLAITLGAANVVRLPQPNQPFNAWPAAPTLEDMVLAYAGDMRGSAGATPGNTVFVGSRTADVAPGPDYGTLIELRVGFDPAAQKAVFYRSYRLRADNSIAATTRALETGYRIDSVGDARILSFDALPEGFEQDHGYVRHYAQWGGAVLCAFKSAVPATPNHSIRLNGTAASALFQVLGVN